VKVVVFLLVCLALCCSSVVAARQDPPTYILYELDSGTVIASSNHEQVRSIASITKLMTILVVLRANLPMDEPLAVVGKEASARISRGMLLSRQRLVELALITSDNLAARTLAEHYPGGYTAFIVAMNTAAQELGMSSTHYEDSTGLLALNRSNSSDLQRLVLETAQWDIFRFSANTVDIIFSALRRSRTVSISGRNTNTYAGKLYILTAKTGFTSAAGRCLTMLFTHKNKRYYLLVMGAESSHQRKKIVDSLLDKIR
jgi:D-alanyl-D-alanine endopeptidase (penicillin-binding protein 7)